MNGSSIGHLPSGAWEFDQQVTECFDDMLARSIPDLAGLRALCHSLGRKYVQDGTAVLDLGFSLGGASADFIQEFAGRVEFYGWERSDPMRETAKERWAAQIAGGGLRLSGQDITAPWPDLPACSLVLSVLTLMFTPYETRLETLRKARGVLAPKGALLFVEKVTSLHPQMEDLLHGNYHDFKERNGYSREAIAAKAQSLKGVLRPQTVQANSALLSAAGFSAHECFWKHLNFAAWVAIK